MPQIVTWNEGRRVSILQCQHNPARSASELSAHRTRQGRTCIPGVIHSRGAKFRSSRTGVEFNRMHNEWQHKRSIGGHWIAKLERVAGDLNAVLLVMAVGLA